LIQSGSGGSLEDPKQGVGQADIYQMMGYAHVSGCSCIMLLYPHHHELVDAEGIVACHQIANERHSLIGIAAIDLLSPKKVGPFLRSLLLTKGAAFDLTTSIGSQGVGSAASLQAQTARTNALS
jgi:5-methylcytosine-specific restriction enzyme subunit McrC